LILWGERAPDPFLVLRSGFLIYFLGKKEKEKKKRERRGKKGRGKGSCFGGGRPEARDLRDTLA